MTPKQSLVYNRILKAKKALDQAKEHFEMAIVYSNADTNLCTPDIAHFHQQVKDILSVDHGEAGLESFISILTKEWGA